jgi:hypothetical protein
MHVEQVLGDVPTGERCQGHGASESAADKRPLLTRLLGR